jgi:serine/threonine-protein kinase
LTDSEEHPLAAERAESYCAACGRSYADTLDVCPDDGARLVRLAARVDPMIGRVLDERFEVRARLGRGGMGTVYRAWQRSVDREVAIKVIDARLADDRVAAKRFLREARLASRLSQPSIVNVHDFGQTPDGVLYLVMEMLRGRTLAQLTEADGPLSVRRALAIGVQLCDALEAAHAQGIIHRDLKPQNILVLDDPPGRDLVKVLDFGLAKSLAGDTTAVTQSDGFVGTPLYLAPEVIQGQPAQPASDLYSLGCILHEQLGGAPPFWGSTANMVLARHLSETASALPPLVPAPVRELVAALLAKDPAERPASAAEVRATLLAVVQSREALDHAPARAPRHAALAETLATPTRTGVDTRAPATPARAEVEPSAPAAPRGAARAWRIGAVVAVVAVGASLAVWLASREDAPAPRGVAPVDARPAVATPDAAPAITPAAADAGVDAASPPPVRPTLDAGPGRTRDRARPRDRDPAPATDAASGPAEPELDFIRPGSGAPR